MPPSGNGSLIDKGIGESVAGCKSLLLPMRSSAARWIARQVYGLSEMEILDF